MGALEACEAELASCQEQPGITFPGDGWPEDAYPSGGAPLSYTDNGDTFTDDNTGLMWEIKLAADGSLCDFEEQVDRNVHCVQNRYTWTADVEEPSWAFDGTAKTEFLALLNDAQFAGHDDWRLPTVKELQSLVDYGAYSPAASFPGETAIDFELDSSGVYYWSSTSTVDVHYAWDVSGSVGNVLSHVKVNAYHVRAVRGGW